MHFWAEVGWESQHGFKKGISCLNNVSAFCNDKTGFVDEGRAVDVIYLNFSKTFMAVFTIISVSKCYELTLVSS